jgi:CarD family transcriptional regulator
MQFKVGDAVVHPAYGVGRIVEIEEKRTPEKGKQLYCKLIWPERTAWVPIESQATLRLRSVTAKSDLDKYRKLLKSAPMPLPQKHYQRHLELANRLRQGSFQIICEVVRDLTAWGERKPLGPTDMATLQKTQDKLYQEWAAAAGISIEEAIKEVGSLLQANSQAPMRVI